MNKRILGMIMAGGEGARLYPLTRDRAKPAVTFGGKYRIIDFVLSNFVNSGIYSMYVLIQFKAQSLIEHLRHGWQFSGLIDDYFITPVPAQMKTEEKAWYKGTADAIYQNLDLIDNFRPHIVAVFGADHIYRMDLMQMVAYHYEKNSEATVAVLPVPLPQASAFGVVQVNEQWRIVGFEEKPEDPTPIPGNPSMALVSLGNYLFNKSLLTKELIKDAAYNSEHDFGKSIFPDIFREKRVYAYDLKTNQVPGWVKEEELGYWRDVGTIKSYWEANMDLKNPNPIFPLYNPEWPLRTVNYNDPPAKFLFDEEGRRGIAVNSIISEGTTISGGRVADSILGRNTFIHSYSEVTNSILMDHVDVGRGARIRRAIIDKDVQVPSEIEIGYNLERDKERFYVDEESGIVVIPKGAVF